MIKNRKQLAVAERKVRGLRAAREEVTDTPDKGAFDDLIQTVEGDIAEYTAISSGAVRTFNVSSLDDLGQAVIKARLSRGWTQGELAAEMGVTEQNVQRDERRDYENAGLARVAEILDALDYEFVGSLRPRQTRAVDCREGVSLSNYVYVQVTSSSAPVLHADSMVNYLTHAPHIGKLSSGHVLSCDAQTDRAVDIL